MTNAPGYRLTQQDRPVNQVMGRSYATAQSEGAGVGAAMANLGGAVSKVGDVMEFRSRLKGDADVRVQMEGLRSDQRDIYNRFQTATGSDAAGARERTERELEEARQRRAAEIRNPRDREAFLQKSYDLQMQRLDQVNAHGVQQERAYVEASRQATVSGLRDEALNSYDDEELFNTNLNAAVAEQLALHNLTGTEGPMADETTRKLVDDTIAGRVILMADKNPEAAWNYIEGETRLSEGKKLELRETIEPMVREQRVNGMMTQFMTTGLDGSSWAGALAGAESAGGRARTNRGGPGGTPASSASGLYHYIDRTWIGNLRRMRDAGALPAEYAGMTDAQLAGLKNDDRLATALVEFDAAIYDKVAVEAGLTPTMQTRYVMHHFGEGAGRGILRGMATNPSAPARSLYTEAQWKEVVKANKNVLHFGSTIGDLYAFAGAHIGKGARLAGEQGVVGFDYAAAYDFAQTIPDQQDREAFIQTVRAREATTAAARTAHLGATLDRVQTDFITTGNSTLTLGDKLALGAEGMSAFQTFVKNTETGSFVDDIDTYGTLTRMATSGDPRTQAAFTAPGYLEGMRHMLTDSTYKQFVAQRSSMEAAAEGRAFTEEQLRQNPMLAAPMTNDTRTRIGAHLDRIGIKDKDQKTRGEAERLMETRVQAAMAEFYLQNRRPPEGPEIEDIIFAQTLTTQQGGLLSSEQFVFQFDTLPDDARLSTAIEYSAVPLTERRALAARLESVLGTKPTEEQIVAAYAAGVMTRGQLAPTGFASEIAEVPMDAYTYYAGFLGASDAEVQAMWEEYLRGVATGDIDPDTEPFFQP